MNPRPSACDQSVALFPRLLTTPPYGSIIMQEVHKIYRAILAFEAIFLTSQPCPGTRVPRVIPQEFLTDVNNTLISEPLLTCVNNRLITFVIKRLITCKKSNYLHVRK